MKKVIIAVILWVLVIGWIGILLTMSAQPGKVSGKLSGDILRNIYDNAEDGEIDKDRFDKDLFVRAYQGEIRRLAHLIIFTILGIFAAAASLYTFSNTAKGYVLPFVIAISYSVIDELVQYITPGRAFEWGDLWRDIAGSVIGIILVCIIYHIFRKIEKRRKV